jgi:hypothetical protein
LLMVACAIPISCGDSIADDEQGTATGGGSANGTSTNGSTTGSGGDQLMGSVDNFCECTCERCGLDERDICNILHERFFENAALAAGCDAALTTYGACLAGAVCIDYSWEPSCAAERTAVLDCVCPFAAATCDVALGPGTLKPVCESGYEYCMARCIGAREACDQTTFDGCESDCPVP